MKSTTIKKSIVKNQGFALYYIHDYINCMIPFKNDDECREYLFKRHKLTNVVFN